jgi:hypothetical protein
MGAAGRASAEGDFSRQVVGEIFLSAYDRVLGRE